MLGSLLLAVTVVAHEPGYTTSLANHIERWLRGESVQSKVVTPAQMPAALKNESLAFLVGFSQPTAAEMKTLREFRSRGGKLVVFHSASPALADLMGVKPVGYSAAPYPGAWSRMDFCANHAESRKHNASGVERHHQHYCHPDVKEGGVFCDSVIVVFQHVNY